MKNGYLHEKSTVEKLFYFFMLCLIGKLFFSGLSYYASNWIFNCDLNTIIIGKNLETNTLRAYKFAAVLDQIGTFFIPALVFCYFFSKSFLDYLTLHSLKKSLVLIVPASFVIMYFSSILMLEINQKIDFSFLGDEILASFNENQELLEKIHYSFIGISYSNLAGCILVMAVVPAICEELVFRGILQQLLSKWFNNIHLGIVFSAVIFAVLHFQFLNLLALLFIGIFLGYIVCITNNLWTSIILHFLYNLISVFTIFLEKKSGFNLQHFTERTPNYIFSIVGLVSLLCLIALLGKNNLFSSTKEKYLQ